MELGFIYGKMIRLLGKTEKINNKQIIIIKNMPFFLNNMNNCIL